MQLVRALIRSVVDFMLPPRCPGCSSMVSGDHLFCADCWMALDFLGDEGCSRCTIPLNTEDGPTCAKCLRAPPTYDAVIAAVAYGDISRRVVLRLKYARRPGLARTIAAILAARMPIGAVLVPVPLHRWRLWQRGFNQSVAIARALQRQRGLDCDVTMLRRTRATPSLRGLNGFQRKSAMARAFAVSGRLEGTHILLVDDVLTTGATANACAATLKEAGAARVTLVCWARVVRSAALFD